DCRHAGAAFAALDLDAVDVGVENAREAVDRLGHFGGRDVLAFPAEGVANTIHEIEIAVLIAPHQVAGAEPGIADLEDVAQDLGFALGGDRVALEAIAGARSVVDDLADHLARLVGGAAFAETLRVAHRLLPLDIETHDL